jgi:hypothetical protein
MTMTTMRQALEEAMHLPADGDTLGRLHGRGFAIADEDTMSRAIHDVYCGIMADHSHPNEKDQEQARQVLAAIQAQGT